MSGVPFLSSSGRLLECYTKDVISVLSVDKFSARFDLYIVTD